MKPALVAIGKEIAREALLLGIRSFRDWLRARREKREYWESIQERHVERRDLSDDPRPKK